MRSFALSALLAFAFAGCNASPSAAGAPKATEVQLVLAKAPA